MLCDLSPQLFVCWHQYLPLLAQDIHVTLTKMFSNPQRELKGVSGKVLMTVVTKTDSVI